MSAVGSVPRYYAGARVRVVEGAHAGRLGTLLTGGELAADIVHVEIDGDSTPRGVFVRIRLGALVLEVVHA